MPTVNIKLPGLPVSPSTLSFHLQKSLLYRFLSAELNSLASEPFSSKSLGRLKQSTIERKRREGYSSPTQPLVATGALERSIRLRITPRGIEITAAGYAGYHRRRALGILRSSELEAAVDRALIKWLDRVIKVR